MCSYLDKVGATYYFRRAVPDELRPYILTATGKPRTEWKISLRTKDREHAKTLIPSHTIETDALMASAREKLAGRPATTRATPSARALSQDEIEHMEWQDEQNAARDHRHEEAEELVAFIKGRLRGSTAQMPLELRAYKYVFDEIGYERDLLKEQLAIATAKVAERDASVPVPVAVNKSALPLLETFDAYAAARDVSANIARDWRHNLESLKLYLGHDDLTRLTTEDVMGWRDRLLAERTKRGTARTPRTVKGGYLTPLRAMLAWLVGERKLPVNVASGVSVPVRKQVKLRERDFTADEAMAILRASLVPAPARMAEENKRARRWIPWLCAYTGGRVNEYSQLRGIDVQLIDGIWTLNITPDAGTVKGKKARLVPLHPDLIEQGFLKAVKANGDGPLFYDPDRQRVQSVDNRHSKKVGERLASWVRNTVGITDENIMPNHAWRHLFKTRTLEHGIEQRIADAIQGHGPKSVGETYGSVPLKAKADAIARLPRFEV